MVPPALMMVGVAVPAVGGPWVLSSVSCWYPWLGARWVALVVFVRQSSWRPW